MKELLRDWNESGKIETIFNWVYLYEIKFNDFNKKKNSSMSNDDINKSHYSTYSV